MRLVDFSCWLGVQPARNIGKAVAAAKVPVAIMKERRLSCREAISGKVCSLLRLGAGWAQALSHLRWQVTALRLPWIWPTIGRSSCIGIVGESRLPELPGCRLS